MLGVNAERNVKLRAVIGVTIAIIISCFFAGTSAALAQVDGFKIIVPRKTAIGQVQIKKLKVTVTVADETPVTFIVSDPRTPPVVRPSPAVALMPDGPDIGLQSFAPPPPPPATTADKLSITTPKTAGLMPNDPARRKYVFVISLDSNSDANCMDTMGGAPETWKIERTAGPQITNVCVQSLDSNTSVAGACGVTFRPVPLTEPVATVTKLDDTPLAKSELGCRPGVDLVLVLDRSGSMSGSPGGSSTEPSKIKELRKSVKSFMNVWKTLRADEPSMTPNIESPADQVGVVFFDTTASWLKTLIPASAIDGLKPFDSAEPDVSTNVDLVDPAALTSIGDGLILGANAFSSMAAKPENRKVILLMTDGIQNTDPMAGTNPGKTEVQTTTGANPPVPLPNQPQIYSVTVGFGAAILPTVPQAIAEASGGFYINTEADGLILPTLFLEVLQNTLKFSTVETFRIVSDKTPIRSSTAEGNVPFQTAIPITTTAQSVVFHLNWNSGLGRLRLTAQPPGGAAPIVLTPTENDFSGTLILNQVLPIKGQQNSGGDWGVKVEVLPGGDKGTPVRVIPFNLMVLGDDAALNSDMITVAADYAPGDKIRVQARVNEFEKPLLNLDTQRGAKMLAKLVRPGVSLGDLLSDSTASSTPLPGQDKLTSAQAKLENTLLANPSAFVRNEDTLRLLDNGDPANGDAVAGDGIYSAVFPAQLEGHYNFLFALEGNTQNLGRFSRQQLKTVHVRAVPDAQSTQVQTHVQVTPDGNKFIITLTPRTKFGHRMGPGWANYFWFTSPGISPFKATDNLNGTFTANLSFNGSKPPPVQVHFLDIPVLIGDSVTPDKLPVPLDDKNVFIPSVNGSDSGPFRFSLFAAIGSNFPHGTFNTVFDTNVSLNGGLEYMATNHFSVEGLFGYHRFGSISSSINLNLYQVSANGKVYGGSGRVRPFANFGGGVYKFGSGTTEFGNNVGGGVQFNLSPRLAIEGGYNFHSVYTSGSATKFSTLQGGVRVRF